MYNVKCIIHPITKLWTLPARTMSYTPQFSSNLLNILFARAPSYKLTSSSSWNFTLSVLWVIYSTCCTDHDTQRYSSLISSSIGSSKNSPTRCNDHEIKFNVRNLLVLTNFRILPELEESNNELKGVMIWVASAGCYGDITAWHCDVTTS